MSAVLYQLVGVWVVDEKSLSECSYPDAPVLAAHDVLHRGADVDAILCALVEAGELFRLPVVDIESESATEPDVVAMLMQRGDGVALYAALPFGHVAVDVVLYAVEAVQSVAGAEPHEAVSVAQSAQHIVVAETVGSHIVAEHDGKGRVEPQYI